MFLKSSFFFKPHGVNNTYCTCGRHGELHPGSPSRKDLPRGAVPSAASLLLAALSGSAFTQREAPPKAEPAPGSPHFRQGYEGLSEEHSDEQYLFQSPLPLPNVPTFTFLS